MGDPVDLSISQFVDAWRLMCAPAPGRRTASVPGAEYIFSGLPIPFFNVILPTQRGIGAAALRRFGADAVAWAAPTGLPYLFVVTHEALDPGAGAAEALEECGLAPLMNLTGMRAERVAPPPAVPAGLQLTLAEDDAACADVLDVNAAAYGMPLDAGKDVIGRSAFWKDHFAVVGRVDGEPVSCAAVLMADSHRYVALVATQPGRQRRGYADAAMRQALAESARKHGECPTVLHATDAGRPVYERMGYQAISTHTVFIEKKFLEGH